jgi:asparagine synthase (glutamine-hydrolysing)
MCGIAGILRWAGQPPEPAEIEAMTRTLAHRGPDGEGFYLRDGLALGHRRLAIIDLEGGRQPMSNESGSVWVSFNGEIYNYQDLRQQLQASGHTFASRSDTEVIVHAYEEWGPEAVKRFRGMFAFAIADFAKRQLVLARDHFGIKPLYYRLGRDYVAFASELAALREVHDAAPRGRIEAVDYYLRYRYIPGPGTIYEDIYQLPPATWLAIDFNGQRGEPSNYWQLVFEPKNGRSDDQWLEEFEAAVHDSVRAHLVADVPFGVFLSGGIDSTLVARTMSALLDRPVTAFSIAFDEEEFSELSYASQAAQTLGIELKSEVVTPDVAQLIPQLVEHYGQPYADTSMIPTWYVSRLARKHVPMVLSGDGGDEAFAGYPRYEGWLRDGLGRETLALLASPRSVLLRVPRILRRLAATTQGQIQQWEDWISLMSPEIRRSLWRPEHHSLVDQRCPLLVRAATQAQGFDRVARAQYFDYQSYLPDDILTKVDIASMFHGLEVRPPLIDVKVVELAAGLPMDQRYRRNGKGSVLKWLPKQSLRNSFAPGFVDRAKMGFGIPEDRWLRRGTPVRRLFDELVLEAGSPLYAWFQRRTIENWTRQLDSCRSTGAWLWIILIFALWREQNSDITFDTFPEQAACRP